MEGLRAIFILPAIFILRAFSTTALIRCSMLADIRLQRKTTMTLSSFPTLLPTQRPTFCATFEEKSV
jgi:hypothetical protein